MRSIVESIERGLHAANYHADLASKRRALSAWGTVERRGAGWSWRRNLPDGLKRTARSVRGSSSTPDAFR